MQSVLCAKLPKHTAVTGRTPVLLLCAVTVDMNAIFTIDKAVPACNILHAYTNKLTGIDVQACKVS